MKAFRLLAMASAVAFALASCSDDDNNNNITDEKPSTESDTTLTEVRVSGTWKTGETIHLDRHLVIPAGRSLTIERGVNVIVSEAGVGVNHAPIEIIADGNLYVKGTEAEPVTFSVAPELRTEANAFKGLWGGIVATETCEELVLDGAVVEYTGGEVIEGSPSAVKGIYTAGGDNYPMLTTTNTRGRYVVQHSTLRRGVSDGIYLMGGQAIIADNRFEANGYTGAEGINIKAGVRADVAGNVIFSPNTNGLKFSSAGQSEVREQCRVAAYNNTIVGAGWRRDGVKGGCIYVEKNALVTVVNNLMVNCRFRAMTPNYGDPCKTDGGWDDKSVIDYNMYAASTADVAANYEKNKNYSPAVDQHSRISSASSLIQPTFVNFPYAKLVLTAFTFSPTWNLHATAGSPVLEGAEGKVTPFFADGLTVGGEKYASPKVQKVFGAYAM